jgi:glycogen operon protein
MTISRLLPGSPAPLGATLVDDGVNFAVYSSNATAIDLCLFDEHDAQIAQLPLPDRSEHVFHGFLPGAGAGTRYAFRAHGAFEPESGHRFNPAKLMIDPYALALAGRADPLGPVLDYVQDADGALRADGTDDAASVPKCVVIDGSFDWGNDRSPRTALKDSVIYEVHVKGFTQRLPGVPEHLRGTYAGLANVAATDYLRQLGVTAVELLPVHTFLDDGTLVSKGLTNYWGYNTLSFFTPDSRYASATSPQDVIAEFKGMVKALHAADIEVILDVVYNHTCEGNHLGPSLSFRGLDNAAYYRLSPADRLYYVDYAGTGNTVNVQHPQVLKLVADSLRYWVEEMHIDGFRFDLAPALGRENPEFDSWSGFFDVIRQDPTLSRVKMIAEPWDLGPNGYQLGGFPIGWSEWNGQFRDEVRLFWRGDGGQLGELASRVAGSAEIYRPTGRPPTASVNFIVAHDGYTLRDLVSYVEKHNEANGEGNRDGHDHNLSSNYGVEGPTDDPAVNTIRARQQRNLMATLLLSLGVPMICGGDEIGRTQQGNNNAYCQDNEISWFDWDLGQEQLDLLEFTKRVIQIRRSQPALRRSTHLDGSRQRASGYKDITWIRPDGKEMQAKDWNIGYARALAYRLGGDAIDDLDPATGEPVVGNTLLVLLNASENGVLFRLPRVPHRVGPSWEALLDTTHPTGFCENALYNGGVTVTVPDRTLMLMRQLPWNPEEERRRTSRRSTRSNR